MMLGQGINLAVSRSDRRMCDRICPTLLGITIIDPIRRWGEEMQTRTQRWSEEMSPRMREELERINERMANRHGMGTENHANYEIGRSSGRSISVQTSPAAENNIYASHNRLIGYGEQSMDVGKLQLTLNRLGYGPIANDCIYGPETRAAVCRFQRDNNLPPDGIVGPLTSEKLSKLTTDIYYETVSGEYADENTDTPMLGANVLLETVTTVGGGVGDFLAATSLIRTTVDFINDYGSMIFRRFNVLYSESNLWRKYMSYPGVYMKFEEKASKALKAMSMASFDVRNARDFLNNKNVVEFFDDVCSTVNHSRRVWNVLSNCRCVRYLGRVFGPLGWIANGMDMLILVNYFAQNDLDRAYDQFAIIIKNTVLGVLSTIAIGALIASGLILVAILVAILFFCIDYFLFNENAGDTLVDRYTPFRTINLIDYMSFSQKEKLYEGVMFVLENTIPAIGIPRKFFRFLLSNR